MRNGEETAVIPIAEERLAVSKHAVEQRVRISTVTEEVPEILREDLRAEHVDIQHIAADRELTERPDVRFEGDLMIIPIVEERLIVEKRLFLVEEVHVRRIESVERIEQPVTLKRQHVVVDRQNIRESTPEER